MATKTAYPNNVTTPAVKGQSAPKGAHPNKPATKPVAQGSKTPYPNTGSGPKQPGKATAKAPAMKAPSSGANVQSKMVGGVLGNLKVGRLGK